MDYEKIIVIEPGKRGGKPTIRGLRITVSDVLDYLASGMTSEEILREWPDLEQEDIYQALGYAAWAMEERVVPLEESIAG